MKTRKEDLFVVIWANSNLVKPGNSRNAKTAHSIPNTDGFDLDQIAIRLVHSRVAHLLKSSTVLSRSPRASRLFVKGNVGKLIIVVLVPPMLHILENGVKVIDAISGQEAESRNHAGH